MFLYKKGADTNCTFTENGAKKKVWLNEVNRPLWLVKTNPLHHYIIKKLNPYV